MQTAPRGERLHIAIFGRRNVGKSSLINALTNQEIAVVSDVPGTTTDPVYKSMEILPVGPVVLIDTAGIDDVGTLGVKRIEKTKKILRKTDIALIIIDPQLGYDTFEKELVGEIEKSKIKYQFIVNKIDLFSVRKEELNLPHTPLFISSMTGEGIKYLREYLAKISPVDTGPSTIIGDLIGPGDSVILVTPIDSAAPKGRLILPQVQVLRDILDHQGLSIVVKETELKKALLNLKKKPKIVITDSQAFEIVAKTTPEDILMTSFSVAFARYRGDIKKLSEGAEAVDKLKPGDNILIAEACTHHPQKDDIGRIKIPRWLKENVGEELNINWTVGGDFPEDVSQYRLIIHCGGCMLNRREILRRIDIANKNKVPIVNYGILIAKIHGLLDRALKPFENDLKDFLFQQNKKMVKA